MVEISKITKKGKSIELGENVNLAAKQQVLFKNANIGEDVVVRVVNSE